MAKVEILGVKIDDLSLQEILVQIDKFLDSTDPHYIVTPNPEFLVAAQKNKKFKEILNYADIATADGVGLTYAAKFLGQRLQRITGVDLIWYICQLAEQKSCSVYFLGAGKSVAEKTAEVLKQEFPNLKIAGSQSGGEITDPQLINQELIDQINQAAPQIIFVALGQIKQEEWIFYHLDKLPTVRLAMGVGGAFDYISETVPRAPEYLRKIGLEWLYRLIKEPTRWQRIINAVIVFPFLIIKNRLHLKR
ncbi:MAG: WecB/TagA/CpsF family glycosyltransferase [Candidatus Buchananbacteria bacterium]